jgi:NAD(P)H-dependent FMN reductase
MKIVAINGSHRGERGYTQFLIDKVFEGIQHAGAQCETIVLSQHKINRCLGCRVCHTEKSYLKCVYDEKDEVSQLFDIMRSADMLVYATPIYIFTMTGLMKIFLDRITSTADSAILSLSDSGLFFHHIDKKLLSKPFVVLTCQDNFEFETSINVVSYFRTFSRFLDAPLAGILIRTSGSLVGHGKDKEKERQYPKIQQVYAALVKAGEELVMYGKISANTQKIANQPIINIPKVIELLLQLSVIRKNKTIMERIFQQAAIRKNEND